MKRTPLSLLALASLAGSAGAERHVMQAGETLEHVARAHGCSVDSLLQHNRLKTILVRAGKVVEIPTCTLRTRARTRESLPARVSDSADARARRALAVIDGATIVASSRVEVEADGPTESVGAPWNGRLRNGEPLQGGEGYRVRRPQRAFGAAHVVDHLRRTIAEVRALYPDVHTLAIGDLSARDGGKLANHQSHQTGLDVDIGFYFHTMPARYPETFVAANHDLDLEATWALITSFARSSELPDGVQMIFLDHDVQARLYHWAKRRGTPDDQLAALLQYPRGKDTPIAIVRHWPHHADHIHVRFKPAR